MLRAILVALLWGAVLALTARLILRWRVRRLGTTLHRLPVHGGVEYATFALMVATAVLATAAERGDSGLLLAVAAVVAGVATLAAYAVFLSHAYWTVEGAGAWDPLRRQRFVRFAEASAVRRRLFGLVLAIEAPGGGLWLSRLRTGIADLEAFVAVRHPALGPEPKA